MAKNYQLILGENNNWEVASFLLINHLYVSSLRISHIKFSRPDICSSIEALSFIENLLGPIGYVVDRTLSNSISSAVTRLEQKGYLNCEDGECILTNEGLKRLQEIKDKYSENCVEATGKNRKIFEALKNLDPKKRREVLRNYNNLSSK